MEKKKMSAAKIKGRLGYILVLVCFLLVIFCCPKLEVGESYGIWTLLPPVMIFAFILLTKNIIEGFFWTAFLTCAMKYHSLGDFAGGFVTDLFTQVTNWDNWWVLYIFLLGGVITFLFKKSGAGTAFVRWIATKIHSRKAAMFVLSLVCIPLSVDDYMCALVTGNVFSPLLDEYKVPREMTTYVIRASATSPAALLPIGCWAIYVGGLIDANGIDIGTYSSGLAWFMAKVMPFLFFPFACLLVCWLVIFGVIPIFGKMKKAYERVEAGGPAVPPVVKERLVEEEEEEEEVAPEPRPRVNLSHFFVPVLLIFVFGYLFEWDMAYGITWGILGSFIYYVITRVFDTTDCLNCIVEGFGYMSEMCVLYGIALVMVGNLGDMGFVEYVVGLIGTSVSAGILPFVIFLVFTITEMLVTFNYTLYLMALPIVYQLAVNVGANPALCIAALMSTGIVGYMLAFSSDGGIIACGSCGKVDLYEQNLCQYPYHVIATVVAGIAYLVVGLIA